MTMVLQLVNFSKPGTAGTQNTNAVLTIINDDFYGDLGFNVTNYTVMENGGYATITVIRRDASAAGAQVSCATVGDPAKAGRDYVATNNILAFAANQMAQSFNVTILDTSATNAAYQIGRASGSE